MPSLHPARPRPKRARRVRLTSSWPFLRRERRAATCAALIARWPR